MGNETDPKVTYRAATNFHNNLLIIILMNRLIIWSIECQKIVKHFQ